MRWTAIDPRSLKRAQPLRNRGNDLPLRYGIEGYGQAGLGALEGHGPVPEVRWKQHQHADLGAYGVFGGERRRCQDTRLAEGESAFRGLVVAYAVGQADIASRGTPAARRHVVAVKPRRVQPDRPTAVETPTTVIATAQRIGAVADLFEVVADGCDKRAEQRSKDRIGASRQILSGFRTVAERLKQQRVAMRVVQADETDLEVGEKTGHIRPARRRLER